MKPAQPSPPERNWNWCRRGCRRRFLHNARPAVLVRLQFAILQREVVEGVLHAQELAAVQLAVISQELVLHLADLTLVVEQFDALLIGQRLVGDAAGDAFDIARLTLINRLHIDIAVLQLLASGIALQLVDLDLHIVKRRRHLDVVAAIDAAIGAQLVLDLLRRIELLADGLRFLVGERAGLDARLKLLLQRGLALVDGFAIFLECQVHAHIVAAKAVDVVGGLAQLVEQHFLFGGHQFAVTLTQLHFLLVEFILALQQRFGFFLCQRAVLDSGLDAVGEVFLNRVQLLAVNGGGAVEIGPFVIGGKLHDLLVSGHLLGRDRLLLGVRKAIGWAVFA